MQAMVDGHGAPPWDWEVDLLVFGSGAGGMMAALVAAHEGLEVLLCEKTAHVGGTTAQSGGTLWIPANPLAADAGIADTLADAQTYLSGEAGADDPRGLRAAFLESGPQAVQFLRTATDVRLSAYGKHPDYHPDAPGATLRGRALAPVAFDGRELRRAFELVRRPREEFMALGGMMVAREEIGLFVRPWASWKAFSFTVRTVLRHLADRLGHSRGTRLLMGNALVGRFLKSLLARGVAIEVEAPLVDLIVEDGCAVGAVVGLAPESRRIRARKGIVLATGGYGASEPLRKEVMGDFYTPYALTTPASAGDSMSAARRVGAAVEKAMQSPALWMPASVLRGADGAVRTFPHIRERSKPGLVAVDQSGHRFTDESASYHDFCMAMFARNATVPAIPAYLVFDRTFLRNYGMGPIRPLWQVLGPYVRAGYLMRARTVAALARAIGVPPEALEETLSRHNEAAADGVDPFGKGSHALGRHNGDPAATPNPCLRPIIDAPFFALPVHPAILSTSAGLMTDRDGQLLTVEGAPIPGLYAVGNDMASVMRGSYPGPGTTIGPAVAFAYRAARHAARRNAGASSPAEAGR